MKQMSVRRNTLQLWTVMIDHVKRVFQCPPKKRGVEDAATISLLLDDNEDGDE
jgi:hypothetical protein